MAHRENRNILDSPAAKRVKISTFSQPLLVPSKDSSVTSSSNEYTEQIIDLLLEKEQIRLPFHNKSPQANWRQTFVRLIQTFANNNGYSRTTLHLAVYFFDLFMDNYQIEYWRLCMVALNSIWLAAKLEESSAPKVSHLNAQLISPYEPKDYTNLERIMVHFFQWNLLVPTAATFLEHYVEELMRNGPDEYFKDGREHMLCTQGAVARLAFEFLDITLSDCNLLYNQLPSVLAASCIAAARHTRHLSYWSEFMQKLTNYTAKDVETNMLILLSLKLDGDATNSGDGRVDSQNNVETDQCILWPVESQCIDHSCRQLSCEDQNIDKQGPSDFLVENDCNSNDMTLCASAVVWSSGTSEETLNAGNAFDFPLIDSTYNMNYLLSLPQNLLRNSGRNVATIANQRQIFWKTESSPNLNSSLLRNDSPEKWIDFGVPDTLENVADFSLEENAAFIDCSRSEKNVN